MTVVDATENQWTVSQYHQSYIFVFMWVGLITFIPLTIFTTVVILRKRVPNACRFTLSCATLGLGSVVSSMLLIQFTLGPMDFQLARGDQLLVGQAESGFLVDSNLFRATVCNQLTILSDQLGIVAWSISVSINRGPVHNYSLTVNEWTLPNNLRLRLDRGDQMAIENYTTPITAILLKGNKAWNRWNSVDTHKLGYEKCCAWGEFQPKKSGHQEPIRIDEDDQYTIILRDYRVGNPILPANMTLVNFSGAVHLQRTRWTPTPCDPIICDGRTKYCQSNITPKRFVLDYMVEDRSGPPMRYANIRLLCHPRYWMLGLIFGTTSLLILGLGIVVWRLRIKAKQMKTTHEMMDCTTDDRRTSRYDRQNMAFELDIV